MSQKSLDVRDASKNAANNIVRIDSEQEVILIACYLRSSLTNSEHTVAFSSVVLPVPLHKLFSLKTIDNVLKLHLPFSSPPFEALLLSEEHLIIPVFFPSISASHQQLL